jgi:hypothetical protein
VKLIFDSSVWIDHLRSGTLDGVIPALRRPAFVAVALEQVAGHRR